MNSWEQNLKKPEPERREKRSTGVRKVTADTREKRYAESALNAESAKVRDAGKGERNNVLNAAAYSLGQLVAAGALDESTVERELRTAAEDAGLGDSEIRKTLASGLDAGKHAPREIPAPRMRCTVETQFVESEDGECTEVDVIEVTDDRMDDSPELTDDDAPNAPPKSAASERRSSNEEPRSATGKTATAPARSPKPVAFRSLGDRLRSAASAGPRHATGIGPLDVHLRGGIRTGKTVAAGGAPGTGKTTLTAQMGRNLARSGVAVCFLANDEEAAGVDARNLESIGISRDHAEEPTAEDIEHAERQIGVLPLEVLEDVTLEDAFEALALKYPDLPRCIISDSIQTTRTRQSAYIESIRERATDVVVTAKRCARDPKTAAFVIFTSELARGAYKSKKREEQTESLASFKESGGIEYGVDVALVLKTAKGDGALVTVEIVKNRTGTKGEFALRLDFETATFTPEDMPADEDAASVADRKRDAALGNLERDAKSLAKIVFENPGIGERDLRAAVKAAGYTWGRDTLSALKLRLMKGLNGSRLVNRGKSTHANEWHLEPMTEDR